MAFLYVDEFDKLAVDAYGQSVMAPLYPPLASYRIAISGSSVSSDAFSGHTRFIQYHSDAICSIVINASPTAVNTVGRMAANETRFVGAQPGDKIAVITNS